MNNDVNKQGSDFTVAHPAPHNDLFFKGTRIEYDKAMPSGPGESPSSDAIAAVFEAVAKHNDSLAVPSAMHSRHSPEGIDEVLESAQREDVKLTASEAARERAKHAADMLDAWVRGETLEWRKLVSVVWMEYVSSLYMPNVTSAELEWRVKRTPRKVYVAFHDGGSVADVRSSIPPRGFLIGDGPHSKQVEDYIEFEEVIR